MDLVGLSCGGGGDSTRASNYEGDTPNLFPPFRSKTRGLDLYHNLCRRHDGEGSYKDPFPSCSLIKCTSSRTFGVLCTDDIYV